MAALLQGETANFQDDIAIEHALILCRHCDSCAACKQELRATLLAIIDKYNYKRECPYAADLVRSINWQRPLGIAHRLVIHRHCLRCSYCNCAIGALHELKVTTRTDIWDLNNILAVLLGLPVHDEVNEHNSTLPTSAYAGPLGDNIRKKPKLLRSLMKYKLDSLGAPRTLAQRLAEENTWSDEFTALAITEYKRFLYLGAIADYPIVPSPTIDKVWHLHLEYTRNYFIEMAELLGCTLHHEPATGNPDEQLRLRDDYKQTLALYHQVFGHYPPEQTWENYTLQQQNCCTYSCWNSCSVATHTVIKVPESGPMSDGQASK